MHRVPAEIILASFGVLLLVLALLVITGRVWRAIPTAAIVCISAATPELVPRRRNLARMAVPSAASKNKNRL